MDFAAIGIRVKKARRMVNLTQEQFAEKANVSTTHVSNIENNHTKLSIETLSKFSIILEVSTDYLLFGANIHNSSEKIISVPTDLLSKKELIILSSIVDSTIQVLLQTR